MGTLRAFLLTRRRLAWVLVALALATRALVPAGYMPGGAGERGQGRFLSISICADGSGGDHARQVMIPLAANPDPSRDAGGKGQEGNGHGGCAFSALSLAALGGADTVLLAAALAFVLAIGFGAAPRPRLARIVHLRPPLRGPPARA